MASLALSFRGGGDTLLCLRRFGDGVSLDAVMRLTDRSAIQGPVLDTARATDGPVLSGTQAAPWRAQVG